MEILTFFFGKFVLSLAWEAAKAVVWLTVASIFYLVLFGDSDA